MNQNHLIRWIVVLCAILVTSCASNDSDGSRSSSNDVGKRPSRSREESPTGGRESGGGLWNMLAEERRRKEAAVVANRERQDRLRIQNEKGRAQVPEEQRRRSPQQP